MCHDVLGGHVASPYGVIRLIAYFISSLSLTGGSQCFISSASLIFLSTQSAQIFVEDGDPQLWRWLTSVSREQCFENGLSG